MEKRDFSVHHGRMGGPRKPRAPRYFDTPVMTVHELAAYLQVHQSTVYRLLKRGLIPAFKLGSDWRFSKVEIDKWVSGKSEVF